MPELPEVESIRLKLGRFIVGHKIIDVRVNNEKIFSGSKEDIINQEIISVDRFGKVLSINLSNQFSILVHVKMTGQLIYVGPNLKSATMSSKITGGVPGKHTHVIFGLDKKGVLYFNDMRRFGWIKITPTKDIKNIKLISHLGPEPLKDLTLGLFREIVSKGKTPIKVLIMDQTKISGIGNIYANDALFVAGINPKRQGKSLSKDEQNNLYNAISLVLKDGIKHGGSSERSFVTPDGQEGNYQNFTRIYNKDKDTCSKCKAEKIVKCKLGGRGTYYCPKCQK